MGTTRGTPADLGVLKGLGFHGQHLERHGCEKLVAERVPAQRRPLLDCIRPDWDVPEKDRKDVLNVPRSRYGQSPEMLWLACIHAKYLPGDDNRVIR